jgi:retron-type reverse transcriptase
MITHNHLYDRICAFDNLVAAAKLAMRGKRFEDAVGKFNANLEREALRLQRELSEQTYRPGAYTTKIITRPKVRMISAAPFRDRVVHHALCRVVMPLFERKMIGDLYSNRPGKGTHQAIRRAQYFSRRHRYVLKADIKKFFPSMDHAALKAAFRRTIACRDTLWLMDTIVDASNAQEPVCTVYPGDDLSEAMSRRVGLPIGNLTSQWFAGVYLSDFDHWVKEQLRCPGYVRYVDDFLLYGDDKRMLANWREQVGVKLAETRLRVNERKTRVFRTCDGVTFLGQRIWPDRRRLCRENVASARRRLLWNVRQYQAGRLDWEALRQRWYSWVGHAEQAQGGGIINQLREQISHAFGTAG